MRLSKTGKWIMAVAIGLVLIMGVVSVVTVFALMDQVGASR
jgi:hypothetical protein